MRVEINVLGSLQASINDVSFVPTASKPRQMLAILALNPGRVVTVTAIMEEIWGQLLPRSVTTTLHTYISHLRRNLDQVLVNQGCSSKEILRTEHAGYLLGGCGAWTRGGLCCILREHRCPSAPRATKCPAARR